MTRERWTYLPLPLAVRDRANDYLRGMAARGFGTTVEEAVRLAQRAEGGSHEQR